MWAFLLMLAMLLSMASSALVGSCKCADLHSVGGLLRQAMF